ncbi:filamentation induced by cAMP protein Fic [Prosthecochloris aestuarii DSM 271]|uniref:Filamentation induced by cAMP protein Fic n=1 Tax=Prosthecochloris aestuarii (strain DSM 271 / SK 413) TaxID=290512 RepID=B4S6U3_PROA2|nr:Fic family protein [Prosthecochloris aestuarii]ACF47298.1 filamentation induced by cAMP protein Fic [Prosthecochloris aestuarii DSM 271]
MSSALTPLPPIDADQLETKAVLTKLSSANRYLAELKGVSGSIPNQGILINTLSLQEAKDSSAIESIITTNDELFKDELFPDFARSAAAKEVRNYVMALRTGFERVQKDRLLTANTILTIHAELERHNSGFRRLPGTELKNEQSGEIVYTPPQKYDTIVDLMRNLESFINDDTVSDIDPLIKVAIIHYQFESIHPFYDGNGRTGRIINVLYLVLKERLDIPVLYLSRYIIRTKQDYYRLLQDVRDTGAWEEWILYILTGIEQTSRQTIRIVQDIQQALMTYKHQIRNDFRFYSQDLINNLFFHPYTKIDFVMRDLKVSRLTATKYLDALAEGDRFLKKAKIGRSNYYINIALFNILAKEETE